MEQPQLVKVLSMLSKFATSPTRLAARAGRFANHSERFSLHNKEISSRQISEFKWLEQIHCVIGLIAKAYLFHSIQESCPG
jgi:hypothetical protein